MTRFVAVALVLGSLVAAGCGDDDDDTGGGEGTQEGGEPVRLVVSAASSMTEALEACAPEFGERENADVRLSFAGSDELAAQLRQGVKPDVFAAANTRIPDELFAEDLINKPIEFATNEFVLAVPADSAIESVSGVAKRGTKIAVGSESVPIGCTRARRWRSCRSTRSRQSWTTSGRTSRM